MARSVVTGTVAGAIATAGMTLAMGAALPVTPGPIGPKQVTGWALEASPAPDIDDPVRTGLTMVNHFLYGSSLGSVLALLTHRSRAGVVRGIVYGLAVWAGNYAGLLPALGVLPPPREDDPGRATRIHLAHWVYGATLGTALQRLRR